MAESIFIAVESIFIDIESIAAGAGVVAGAAMAEVSTVSVSLLEPLQAVRAMAATAKAMRFM